MELSAEVDLASACLLKLRNCVTRSIQYAASDHIFGSSINGLLAIAEAARIAQSKKKGSVAKMHNACLSPERTLFRQFVYINCFIISLCELFAFTSIPNYIYHQQYIYR